jgi:hypothetical protein
VSTITQTFDFHPATSGCIVRSPASGQSYVAITGVTACDVWRKVTATTSEIRAYFQFDTSSIPDHAELLGAEFYQYLHPIQPDGSPEITYLNIWFGPIIGASLDGTRAEWNATLAQNGPLQSTEVSDTWIDLVSEWTQQEIKELLPTVVNVAGTTDVLIFDTSVQGDGSPSWGTAFNGVSSSQYCKLRVTYTVPSGTATGRGIASGVGTVISGGSVVLGTASGTGVGSISASGSIVRSTVAAATGRGSVVALLVGVVVGAATATGRGLVRAHAYFFPMAIHSGRRSVVSASEAGIRTSAVHAAARTVAPADARTCALAPIHNGTRAIVSETATRGARRVDS